MSLPAGRSLLLLAGLCVGLAGPALAGPCPPCERDGFPVHLGWWEDRLLSPPGAEALSPRVDVDANRAAVVWEDRTPGHGDIVLAVTEDGGCTWRETAVTTSPDDDVRPDVTLSVRASTVVVTFVRAGEVHVVTSPDLGRTFGPAEIPVGLAPPDARSVPRLGSILLEDGVLHAHVVWAARGGLHHARSLLGAAPGTWTSGSALSSRFGDWSAWAAPDVSVDTRSSDPASHSAVTIVASGVGPGRSVHEIWALRSNDSGTTFLGDPVDPASLDEPRRLSEPRPDDPALAAREPVVDATDDGTGVFFTWNAVLWSEAPPASPAFGDARAEEGTTPEVVADWNAVDARIGPSASRAAAVACVPNPLGRPPDPELHVFVTDEVAPNEREVVASWGVLERASLPTFRIHCGPHELTGLDPERADGEVVAGSVSADEDLAHAFVTWADTREGGRSRVYFKRSDTWTASVADLRVEPAPCPEGGGLRVSWTPPPSPPHCDVDHVRVDYGTMPGAPDSTMRISEGTEALLTGLMPGATYHVRATVVDEACNEAGAPAVEAVAPDCAGPTCPNPVGPTLRVTKAGADVALGWEPPPADALHDAASSHDVHRSDERPQDGFALVANTPATSFTHAGAAAVGGTPRHFYLIVARNACGTSGDEPEP